MGGTAGQSVTLANSIIGVGILAMPFCFQQCGAVLAVVMLLLSGLVSRLACYFLLKSAIMARRTNFEFLAFHVFGAPGKLAVEVGIIGFLMGTCIAYFVVVGDLGPQIICKMFNINQSDVLRTCVMVLVSVVCVLPLGLLRNVDSLSNVSAATIGFYVCLVIKVIVEATSQLINGDWQSKIELWKPEGVLQCVPIFSMALFCQTQLFEIFETLPTLSLEKMNVVTKNALNICTAVYVMVGSFGYLAFCGQTISGNILVSLSPTMASDVIKLGFVMSLAFSFPLIIFPCRASIYSLLYRKVLPSQHDHIINHSIPEGTFRCITVAIIGVALLVSLMIPNIELVLGLVGSTIGVLVCVIFPAACFVNVTLKNTNERVLAKVILCLGIIVMVLGTYANLQAAESKLDHTDNRYITEDRIDKIVQEFIKSNEQNIKLQDVIITPETKAAQGAVAQSKNIVQKAADSEVQPPNPVAPDSQPEETKKIDTQPQIPAVIVKEDSKYKLDHNDIEGGGDKESLTIAGDSKVKSEEKYSNIKETEKDHVRNGAVADTVVNQKSLDLLKQQELIDTIKRHGEEQKQLMEEQRDILDNLKKTQLEIEKTKKDNIDKEQVKKIAVESIKKMADIAIQSISGVTDTPIEVAKPEKSADNKVDKKIIDDPAAILKKAVETIEAIGKEEKPVLPAINGLPLSHSGMINDKSHDGNQVQSDAQKEANISAMSGNGSKINIDIVDSNNNKAEVVDNMNNKETHIHSPDEPNSYIQGENLELLKQGVVQQKLSPSSVDALVNNVPVPIVMNQNLQNNPSIINEILNSKESKIVSNLQLNNGLNNAQEILENGNINKKISREKRYINCENQVFMSDEEQRKCRNVIILNDINILVPQKLSVPEDVYLGKVDLIPPSYSVDPNVLHQVRSLKSVDELESS